MENNNATMNDPIREKEIRFALLKRMSVNSHGPMIREEFRIERGGSRIDVAEIGAKLVGYEIKSDFDTFARFSNQIHAYNRVFDEIYLVCGQSHANQAIKIIPSWWGVIVAERDMGGEVLLSSMRAAGCNPNQDSFSLASLLWKDEALAVLTSEEKEIPKRASSHVLWDYMAQSLPFEKIKIAVTESLLRRRDYNELMVKAI